MVLFLHLVLRLLMLLPLSQMWAALLGGSNGPKVFAGIQSLGKWKGFVPWILLDKILLLKFHVLLRWRDCDLNSLSRNLVFRCVFRWFAFYRKLSNVFTSSPLPLKNQPRNHIIPLGITLNINYWLLFGKISFWLFFWIISYWRLRRNESTFRVPHQTALVRRTHLKFWVPSASLHCSWILFLGSHFYCLNNGNFALWTTLIIVISRAKLKGFAINNCQNLWVTVESH